MAAKHRFSSTCGLQLIALLVAFIFQGVATHAAAGGDSPGPRPLTKARTADGKHYIGWKEHRLDDTALAKVGLGGADGLAVADLDGDGHMDVVAVHEDCAHHVRISFGTPNPDRWESHTLSSSQKGGDPSRAVGGAEDVVIGDVNGDGRLDVVACGEGGALVYFEAPANPRNMEDWRSTPVAQKGEAKSGWIRVDIADLDGDGQPEILGAHKRGGNAWVCFRREGDASHPDSWKPLVIGTCKMPINVRAVDIDGDGDMDVFGGSRGESKLVLFENLGNDKPWASKWKEHPVVDGKIKLPIPVALTVEGKPVKVSSGWGCSGFMLKFADLNRDGRLDVVTVTKHGGGLLWLQAPASLGGEWKRHYIGHIVPDQATGIELVDINGDGRLDLFTGGYSYTRRRIDTETLVQPNAPCGRLAWFESPADPTQPWTCHEVSRRAQGMYDMFFAHDVNGDGHADLITTRGNSSPQDGTLWLEQVRTAAPGPAFTSAWPQGEDSREQPFPVAASTDR